jgi:hypothetical protein
LAKSSFVFLSDSPKSFIVGVVDEAVADVVAGHGAPADARKAHCRRLRWRTAHRLVNKVRAYALQDHGLDTVDANLALGFRDDERDYAIAAHMLASLNVSSVQLMTNNPDKIRQLAQHGIRVATRVPLVVRPNEHNRFYLETKAARSGHYIDGFGKPHLPEQGEPVVVGA